MNVAYLDHHKDDIVCTVVHRLNQLILFKNYLVFVNYMLGSPSLCISYRWMIIRLVVFERRVRAIYTYTLSCSFTRFVLCVLFLLCLLDKCWSSFLFGEFNLLIHFVFIQSRICCTKFSLQTVSCYFCV